MGRTVIYMQRLNDQEVIFSLWDPRDLPDARKSVPLTAKANVPPYTTLGINGTKGTVRTVGESLYTSIIAQPAVKERLEAVLKAADGSPIYILNEESTEAELLPWETLRQPGRDFMALDGWQIARMVGEPTRQAESLRFKPPLKMLAFLNASGVEAKLEWDALYFALNSSGVPVELTVYVSEESLLEVIDEVRAKEKENENLKIKVSLIERSINFRKLALSGDKAPNIIHFFCHGSSDNQGEIYLANQDDWANKYKGTTVTPRDFDALPGRQENLWVVTLNCCKSSAPVGSEDAQSFARALVQYEYTQAAIGMRESVDAFAAHRFCAEFYAALLSQIAKTLKIPGEEVEFDLATTLQGARRQICELRSQAAMGIDWRAIANDNAEWTLPVLYSQPRTLKLASLKRHKRGKVGDEVEALRAELADLRRDRAALPTLGRTLGMTPEAISAAKDELDAKVESLRDEIHALL